MGFIPQKQVKLTLRKGTAKSIKIKDRQTGRTWIFVEGEERIVPANLGFQLMYYNCFSVDPDPLKDYDLVTRHTGTIGDAVCEAHALQGYLEVNPNSKVMFLTPQYTSLINKIAPNVNTARVLGMGKRYIDFGLRGGPGPLGGFAWEETFSNVLDLKEYPPPKPIIFTDEEISSVKHFLKTERPKLIALQLWSNHARSKSYDPKKVGKLTERIREELNCEVVVLGGLEESNYPGLRAIDLRGKLSLVQSTTVISLCDAVIAVDSWVWHIAKLMLKPQVALFGSVKCRGEPKWWEVAEVLEGHLHLGEEHPDTFDIPDSRIIDSITLDEIIDSLRKVMKRGEVEIPRIEEGLQQYELRKTG